MPQTGGDGDPPRLAIAEKPATSTSTESLESAVGSDIHPREIADSL